MSDPIDAVLDLRPASGIDVAPRREPSPAVDLEAFADELGALRDTLIAYVQRLGADRQDAEDAVSEALARTWAHVALGGAAPRTVHGYLRRAARNAFIDIVRAGSRTVATSTETLDPMLPEPLERGPEALVTTRSQVAAALSDLTPGQRAILWLTICHGLPLADASAQLRLPSAGAAAGLAYRARRAFRNAYDAQSEARRHDHVTSDHAVVTSAAPRHRPWARPWPA